MLWKMVRSLQKDAHGIFITMEDMKQNLQMQRSQQLTMSLQLQQAIRLLQLSGVELEHEIEEALASNVFLERVPHGEGRSEVSVEHGDEAEEPSEGDRDNSNEGQTGDFVVSGYDGMAPHRDAGDEDADPGSYTASHRSLREHLLEQVGTSRLEQRDRILAALIVEALDEDGYLRQPLEELAALIPVEPPSSDELVIALRFVQSLDPIGVAARSLSECLALQLCAHPGTGPELALALAIVRDHLDLLAAHDSLRLTRALNCDEAALRRANCLITSLDPRPGARFAAADVRYVLADVIVKKAGGRWLATVNPEVMPRVRVNRIYAQILQSARVAGGEQFSKQYQEARWLMRNVQHRFQTIQRVAQAIVDRQSGFFEHGELAMRPLILRDIASALNLHESTVSRATSNKFMATERGLIEFKRFFGSQVVSQQGHAWSSTAIRALIRELIAGEDTHAPLSDIKLTRMLGTRGVEVARRTVAKYRGAMRIPPVEARKMATL